jgi:hypothetical protein
MRAPYLLYILLTLVACSKNDLSDPDTPDPGNSDVISARPGCIEIALDENATDTSFVLITRPTGDTVYLARHQGNPIFIDSLGYAGQSYEYHIQAGREYRGTFQPVPLIKELIGTHLMDIRYRYQDGTGAEIDTIHPPSEVRISTGTDPYLDVAFLNLSTSIRNTPEWSDCETDRGNYTIIRELTPTRFEYYWTNHWYFPGTDSLRITYEYNRVGIYWEYILTGKIQ